MVNYQPIKFSGHNNCGNDDLLILVVEKQNSTCFHLILL